uniref:VOC family protein n=1 Tax=Ancylomarina sp. TaxID=1970196 RepID=UPI003569B337
MNIKTLLIGATLLLSVISSQGQINTKSMKNKQEVKEKVYPKTFSHIGITVPDLDKAVKFYTEVMGFYVIMPPTEVIEENETAIGQMCIDVF